MTDVLVASLMQYLLDRHRLDVTVSMAGSWTMTVTASSASTGVQLAVTDLTLDVSLARQMQLHKVMELVDAIMGSLWILTEFV